MNKLNQTNHSTIQFYGSVLGLLLFVVFMSSGCSVPAPKIVVQKPVKAKVVVKKKVPAGRVAIILSDSLPAFTDIANLLKSRLGKRALIYNLKGDITRGKMILDSIQKIDKKQVVSIGLMASKVASILTDTQVIFSQVFNHEDLKLIKPLMKGVSIYPDHKILFKIWKKLDPKIKHIAVVTGSNKEALIKQATKIARKFDIRLTHEVVKTDLDLVHVIKHLPKNVQGIWLLPDNRILSIRAIKDIMNHSVKYGKQVAVFQTELLKLGGLFSTQSKTKEVVRQIIYRLKSSSGKKVIPGPDMRTLKRTKISINARIATLLGLNIPQEYTKYIYE